jgi:prophage regulatory protein
MQTKFIRIRELASAPGRNGLPARHGRLPISYATVWRWVKLGAFPKPVHLGPQTTAWRLEDIERWEAEHALCVKTSHVQEASAQKREAK